MPIRMIGIRLVLESVPKCLHKLSCTYWILENNLPHPVYEVPAIRVNTSKSTYTFTSVVFVESLMGSSVNVELYNRCVKRCI